MPTQVPPSKFQRGAKPSPPNVIRRAEKFAAPLAAPESVAYVPERLSAWGNNQYGVCVTSEEAFLKACHNPLIWIDEQVCIGWARSHGYLNGAYLTEVMDDMIQAGFKVGSQLYNDGRYYLVDFASEADLKAALAIGPVKIAIDGDALPQNAGDVQGWYSWGGRNHPNTDHCVAITGYGTAEQMFKALGVPLPAGVQATKPCYLLFTWGTIGVVDHAWLMTTCVEAWVRNPGTVGVPPLDPTPVPPVPPGPIPPTPPGSGTLNIPAMSVPFTFSVPTANFGGEFNADVAKLAKRLGMSIEQLMALLMTLLQVLLPLIMARGPMALPPGSEPHAE